MTNEIKNVPELRFPEFSSEWEENQLSKLTQLLKDGTHGTHKDVENGAWLLSAKNIKNNNIIFDESDRKISYDDYHKIYKNYQLQKNDLLLSIVGTIGRTALVKDPINLAFQRSVAIIRFENRLSNLFFLYLFQTHTFKKKLLRNQVVSAQPGLYLGDLGKFFVNYPLNYKEQEKIGTFFNKLDRQIELEEQKLEKLEEQKKGYMQKLFSQELRFKDENGDDYPEWMETNIRNTFDNKGGTALEKEFDNNGTHKVISIGSYSMNSTYNEQNLRINKNEFTEKYLLNEGDLAMVLNDKTKEGNIIGKSIYIDEDDKYIYNQRTERLIPVTGNNHKFLWYLMNSEQFRKKIKQMMQGATQVYINYNSIKDLSIYLPILEEQNKIENFLGYIFNIIKNQSDKVELLKRRKKGFLQKMFV
ncbi:restriction endonuclease subunit S [Staphylococcus pettenkoferi]|uniref:restriction endonuclease subunit S n=1 Tax=Staphylococcus pettenkoferi TaxID=170573 RepID=UPI0022730CB6|nr:restriction endonuclease subunit S [Staphylococcus pettenkoferi]MCY1615228.1 restriction endonuclease subunit S [Staphylococcus pettenkoferi]